MLPGTILGFSFAGAVSWRASIFCLITMPFAFWVPGSFAWSALALACGLSAGTSGGNIDLMLLASVTWSFPRQLMMLHILTWRSHINTLCFLSPWELCLVCFELGLWHVSRVFYRGYWLNVVVFGDLTLHYHLSFFKFLWKLTHRKSCECCPRHSLFKGHNVNVNIVVLNCQKCNP